jgi:hypothetical protein
MRDCSPVPHRCGFPDATNTGVRAGITLTRVPGQRTRGPGWKWQAGRIVVYRSGVTLSRLAVSGYIDIYANNVTVNDVAVTEGGQIWGIGLNHANHVTIENSDITGPVANGPGRLEVGIKDVYGDAVGTSVLRTNISHTSTAIQISNGVIAGNYIHDFGYDLGDHLNGISVGGGDLRPLLIRHNTVLDNHDQTDAIALFQDFGTENNKTITGNLIGGGSYVLYGGGPGDGCARITNSPGCYGPSEHIIITNNRFSQLYFRRGGTFGWLAAWNGRGAGNVFSGNVWDAANVPVRVP